MKELDSSLYDKVYWIDKKYRCTYCSLEVYNRHRMVDHESKCDFNPKNKNCLTCDSRCNVQPPGGYGCRKWKNVGFERVKKLEVLKNRIKVDGIH
jgi:hypothetical protein